MLTEFEFVVHFFRFCAFYWSRPPSPQDVKMPDSFKCICFVTNGLLLCCMVKCLQKGLGRYRVVQDEMWHLRNIVVISSLWLHSKTGMQMTNQFFGQNDPLRGLFSLCCHDNANWRKLVIHFLFHFMSFITVPSFIHMPPKEKYAPIEPGYAPLSHLGKEKSTFSQASEIW